MKMKRKFMSIVLAAVMVFSMFAPVEMFAADDVRVTLHGEEVDFGDDAPALINERTYVPRWFIAYLAGEDVVLPEGDMLPLRQTMESLGHTIEWDEATRTANIRLGGEETAATVVAAFMQTLIGGDIMGATMMLSPEMQVALPVELFIFGMHGRVVDYAILDHQQIQEMDVFVIAVNHTKGVAVHLITVDENDIITGFHTLEFAFEPRMPADDANFTAEPVTIGEDTLWPLTGLLTMPRDASAENPVPAVILVHGSGGQNMDSSIFENRPHADIAEYLSSNGIAVLRYNKRTWLHSHGAQFAEVFGDDLNIWDESIEDVLLAAAILQADERISDVFVIGHSLGGMIAPAIAEEAALAGAVMLAASPHPFFVISYHQNLQAIGELLAAGAISQDEADALIAMVRALLDEAWEMIHLPAEELAGAEIFHMPALYQQSIYNVLPLPIIAAGNMPTLIIHGGRDFQVTTELDFQPMVDATQDLAHVTTMYFAGINHLLMQSQTPYNDLRDYHVPGRVDENLLRAIVDWIFSATSEISN